MVEYGCRASENGFQAGQTAKARQGHCVQSLLADKLVLHRDLARVPTPTESQNRQNSVRSSLASIASTLACVASAFAKSRPGFASFEKVTLNGHS